MEDKINPWTCKKKEKYTYTYINWNFYMSCEVIYLYRILFHDWNGKMGPIRPAWERHASGKRMAFSKRIADSSV